MRKQRVIKHVKSALLGFLEIEERIPFLAEQFQTVKELCVNRQLTAVGSRGDAMVIIIVSLNPVGAIESFNLHTVVGLPLIRAIF